NVSRSDRKGAGGDLVIKRPTLSICATTTMGLLRQTVTERLLLSGFLNRHLVLPGSNGAWTFEDEKGASIDYSALHSILDRFHSHTWGHGVVVWRMYTSEARKRMVAWGQEILEPLMNAQAPELEALKRLHVYAHLISMLYAWSSESPKIEM